MQNAFMPSEWTPELSIVSETNTCSIDSVLLESIKQNENVKRAYGRMFAYDVPVNIDGSNHKANVISYEANQFKWSADYLTAGSISVVEQEENQVLVVNTENTDVRVGDADSNSTLFHKSEFAHKLPQSIFSVKSFFAAERDKFTQQTHKNEYLHSNRTYFTINSFQKHQYVLVCSATISNFLRFSQVSFSRFHAKN